LQDKSYFKISFRYNQQAARCVTNPHIRFVAYGNSMSSDIGLYRKLNANPNQKLLHSGHSSGLRIYGIRAIKLRTDKNISEKLYMYAIDTDSVVKYTRSNNITQKRIHTYHHQPSRSFDETPTSPIAFSRLILYMQFQFCLF